VHTSGCACTACRLLLLLLPLLLLPLLLLMRKRASGQQCQLQLLLQRGRCVRAGVCLLCRRKQPAGG
jgi:hypothetical protein